jgi:uncharacterized protein
MMLVTAVFTGVLTLMFIKLSFNVIALRKKHKVSLGHGCIDDLDRAIRTHGNFSEYVPLGLVLMGALEINGAPMLLVVVLGALLVIGRYLHAKGTHEAPPVFTNRVKGMQFTFFALGALALSNIIWVAYVFLACVRFAAVH